ncbi:cobalt transport protein [Coriobacterium glomerans PW2]|uniref:Cobalt transport protein n=1 Tax=Coriobacterium glomerans (strain ATCC 49209 / DSM 20642 / JCM 10262 / PW2) TaxID=700015 RepID=F2NAE8_CORGP|nr:energy-coupling factor transporter transmembrane component T [Coriobacterium glomerans]AEB06334.1 cobalt transport protein [Coriobacterium glomerans PW2]
MALRVDIGRYYSAVSPVHSMDPRVKLIFAIVFMASCLFISNGVTLLLAGILIASAIAAAHVPVGRLLAQLRPLVLFFVLTSVINLFFARTGDLLIVAGPIRIYSDGVSAAILYTMRLIFLLIAGSLLMFTTQPIVLTDAAERLLRPLERIGMPVSRTMFTLSIALRFVPTIAQEADDIITAQTARGADLENRSALGYVRSSIPLLVPLFAGALRHAENLGKAMDARCYLGGRDRTHYHVMRFDPRHDGSALGVLIIYIAALIAAGFFR